MALASVVRRQFNCNPGDWLGTNLVLSCGQQLQIEWTIEWILIALVISGVWKAMTATVLQPWVDTFTHPNHVPDPNAKIRQKQSSNQVTFL